MATQLTRFGRTASPLGTPGGGTRPSAPDDLGLGPSQTITHADA